MATIGRTTIGGSTRSIDNLAKGIRVTMPVSAQAGFSVSAYLADSGGAGDTFVAALVRDDDKDTILATSAPLTTIGAAGWYTFSGGDFATYTPSSGQTFVITIASNSASGATIAQDDAGLDCWASSGFNVSISPLDIVVMNADTNRDYSIYMTYTEAGAGGSAVPVITYHMQQQGIL